MAAPPPPSGEKFVSLGLGGCKTHARRLPFTLSASVMAFAGAKKLGSLARAARWLPPGEEPSKRRDTNGGRQKKAYEKQKFKGRTSASERRPAIIKRPSGGGIQPRGIAESGGDPAAGGISAAVAGVGRTEGQSKRVGRV